MQAFDTIQIIVNPLPVVFAGKDTSVSNTGSYVIADAAINGSIDSNTTGYTLLWSPSDSLSAVDSLHPTISNLQHTTIYSLNVINNATGCHASDTVIITSTGGTVGATILGDALTCPGNAVSLSVLTEGGSGDYDFLWNDGNTDSARTVTPTDTTTYSVTVTDHSDPTKKDADTITVYTYPSPIVSISDTAICIGESVILRVSGNATGYVWSTGATDDSIIVSPTVNTDYIVTGSSIHDCKVSDTATVTVNALPVVFAGKDTTIINTANYTIADASIDGSTDTTGFTVLWSPSDSLNRTDTLHPTISNLQNTTVYTLNVTNDATGCKASDDVTITSIGGAVSVTINSNDTDNIVCPGDTVELSTLVSGGSGDYDFSWTDANTDSIRNVVVMNTTTYIVNVSDHNDTTNTASDTITITTMVPTVNITPSNPTICDGASVTLKVTGNATSYTWSTSATSDSIIVSPNVGTTNYSVTGINSYGCPASDTTTVTVNANPTVSVTANPTSVCPGEEVTLTASGATTYNWITGVSGTTASVTNSPTTTTTYEVVGTTNGCSDTASVSVTVKALPDATFTMDTTRMPTITFTANNTGASDYAWNFGDGVNSSGSTTGHTYTANGTYTVVLVVTENGCKDSTSASLTIMHINIEVVENGTFKVYPNPTSGTVNITADKYYTVSITSIDGKVIYNGKLTTNHTSIDLSNYAKGIYVVKFSDKNTVKTMKLIVK
jgi:PKD repeat protein